MTPAPALFFVMLRWFALAAVFVVLAIGLTLGICMTSFVPS